MTVEYCIIIQSWLFQYEDFGFLIDRLVLDIEQRVDDADISLSESSTVAQRDNNKDKVDDIFDINQDLACMKKENSVLEPGNKLLDFSQSSLAESELADYLL